MIIGGALLTAIEFQGLLNRVAVQIYLWLRIVLDPETKSLRLHLFNQHVCASFPFCFHLSESCSGTIDE
jgi:hypothetical protein